MIRGLAAFRRGMAFPLVLAAALSGVGLLFAAPAGAYVRYRSESGCPYAWRTRTIPIQAFPHGMGDLTVEQITHALTEATTVWTKRLPALAGCTDLDLTLQVHAASRIPPAAKYDHENNVMFRSASWCSTAMDGTMDCHDPAALAITSVFAKGWGQIVDADVEVNAYIFNWADLGQTPDEMGKQDLQNALAHEFGHVLGFDHTCYGDPSRARPDDHTGASVPDCATASPSVKATTMFASADPGDISKRTLEMDDLQAICQSYPLASVDPLACDAPADSGGCAIARGGGMDAGRGWRNAAAGWGAATAVAACLGCALLTVRRLRRRRR